MVLKIVQKQVITMNYLSNALGACSHGNFAMAESIFTPFTKREHNCEVVFILQAICKGLIRYRSYAGLFFFNLVRIALLIII